jgi:tRNA G18 (ribose-2'-O)-methylase SpoU
MREKKSVKLCKISLTSTNPSKNIAYCQVYKKQNTDHDLIMKKDTIISFSNPVFDPNVPRAVVDYQKWMTTVEIMQDLQKNKRNFGILLVNIDYDNNSGNIVRTANAMGALEVILYGRRSFDRRSSMGTEFYMQFQLIRYIQQIEQVLAEYDLIVGLENGLEAQNLMDYQWDKNLKTLICVGQESSGIPDLILQKCHHILEIPQVGSVRSLNVGTAAGIVMYDYCQKTK